MKSRTVEQKQSLPLPWYITLKGEAATGVKIPTTDKIFRESPFCLFFKRRIWGSAKPISPKMMRIWLWNKWKLRQTCSQLLRIVSLCCSSNIDKLKAWLKLPGKKIKEKGNMRRGRGIRKWKFWIAERNKRERKWEVRKKKGKEKIRYEK